MDKNTFFYFFLFLISFAGVLMATWFVLKFAHYHNIVDQPGRHKTHREAKPLLGGLAMFFGFVAFSYAFLDLDGKLISLGLSTVILIITGLLDDICNLKPLYKLVGQTAAATSVTLLNIPFYDNIFDYFQQFIIPLPDSFVVFLIIGWVVLMINAFNLIDGMDGLAAGTAAIIFLAMASLSILEGGRPNLLGVQLIGAGACFGFLYFNFYPAKIFMGDTGSMLLGFVLANSHLFTLREEFSGSLVLGSIFIFAYPALDVSYAIYRRIYRRSPLFKADQGHIHHVLLSLGFSVRKTALVIYAINIFFALMAIILLSLEIAASVLLVIGILTALFVVLFFRYLLVVSNRNVEGVK